MEENSGFAHMQTKGAGMDKQQMRGRKGRWRSANPTQKCLRASSRPRLGILGSAPPSPHPRLALHPSKKKKGKKSILQYCSSSEIPECVATVRNQLSITHTAIRSQFVDLKLQGEAEIAHPPSGFPTCCTNCHRSVLLLDIPPGRRGQAVFPRVGVG